MEVCVDNLESAINAEKGGAMKLELCSTNNDGGLTPSLGLLRIIKKNVNIPVIVMIRPRTGDYIYSDEEIEIMSEDIKIYKEHGADGFVFGIVTPEGKVDVKNCSKLIEQAGNLPVTFSRAFDIIKEPLERMEEIISLGFERILTSGLQETACQGIPLLKQLMEASKDRIVVMPGAVHFFIMEVCVDNLESAVNAELGGAMRLELCSALNDGGLTPSIGFLKIVKKKVKIPVFVMIRPRPGDFIYSDDEIEIMSEDIKILKECGADGFVFGITTSEGEVDIKNCSKLMKLARSHPVTYHRAFDGVKDPLKSMEEIISLGFQRILTSGLQGSAIQGASLLRQLIESSRGRIIIMPGAGINPENLHIILKVT
ncbi:unnamed protein product [Nezara viridula]|uniref:Copper homeostasis protein cutC homolog n=1 Tax=Nezara viridula TaxID=85310 RepID=A0A9P0EGZ3_NEZVI|nr:unnamed protein product [Nezara viridula]